MPQKKPQGQWRGLDTLFLENSVEETVKNQKTTLRIGLIEPKSGQPRKTFEQQPLEQLAASISTHGVLQPILVRELPNGKYQIVAGEHCHSHLHLKCMGCGRLIHLDERVSDELLDRVRACSSFSVSEEETLLFGSCAECRIGGKHD